MDYIKEVRALVGNRPLILVSAMILAVDQERLLMQRRAYTGAWHVPGGYMELGERIEETARRELREETGLEARAIELLSVFSGPGFHWFAPNGDEVHNVTIAFVTREFEGELRADGEEGVEVKVYRPKRPSRKFRATCGTCDYIFQEKPRRFSQMTPLYLGLDTASTYLALALWSPEEGPLATFCEAVGRDHAKRLVPELEGLLERAGVRRSDVSAASGWGWGRGHIRGCASGWRRPRGWLEGVRRPRRGQGLARGDGVRGAWRGGRGGRGFGRAAGQRVRRVCFASKVSGWCRRVRSKRWLVKSLAGAASGRFATSRASRPTRFTLAKRA